MVTLVEPKPRIAALWGKQRVQADERYRVMRYVLRVDRDGKVLLHNVVTGQLAVLDQAEAEALDTLPSAFRPWMEPLITARYLVPEDHDEHRQVVNLRRILQMLDDAHGPKPIFGYTILTTTACNARCYYCYEAGIKPVTMTEETADAVVRFIDGHCGADRKVTLSWFGGEPTVAADRIDRICSGLEGAGIAYRSTMTTNGYLFDEDMADRAVRLWHLESAMISVDGTKENYNRIKAYKNAADNPYQRVMRNIGLLLDRNVRVGLRMNFDRENYTDFEALLEEANRRYRKHPCLMVYAHQINGGRGCEDAADSESLTEWNERQINRMNSASRENGTYRQPAVLPHLKYEPCMAGRDTAATILPDGRLVGCPEYLGDDQVRGSIFEGITDPSLAASWKITREFPECPDCVLCPTCVLLANCGKSNICFRRGDLISRYRDNIWMIADSVQP